MDRGLQPLVSVVTPIYNEAEYLAECIESVRAQTYQNWNYTIVDNCSTDGSGEIALRYAAIDSRIRVVRNRQFLRAIANHNEALRQISPESKYCKVVLGDDWIFPECLERMVAVAEEHPSIGIVGAYSLEGLGVHWVGLPYPSHWVSGREVCRQHLLEKVYVFGSANSVLYRADLVRRNGSFYNEANIHADTEACFAILKDCDFGFVHQVLTFTRVRPRSLTAMSSDLHTECAGMLQTLLAHGPNYLTPEELRECVSRCRADYDHLLGKSLLLRPRDKKFWDYHKKQLNQLGLGFSRRRIGMALLAEVFDAALNPKHSGEKILRRLRRPG